MNQLSYWPQDQEGFLLDLSSADKVLPQYQELLDEIETSCVQLIGTEQVHSLYLIGSIVTGKAKPGISDADVIVLLNDSAVVNNATVSALKQLERQLVEKFPIVTKVSIKVKALADIIGGKEIFRCFLIRTQGLCIHGKDIKSQLPMFKPDQNIAVPKIQKLEKYIREAETAISNSQDPQEISNWCRKIFKVILRTCGLLVITQEQKYSNDPYTCLQSFIKYYPPLTKQLQECLALIHTPSADKTLLLEKLKTSGNLLLPIAKAWSKAAMNG